MTRSSTLPFATTLIAGMLLAGCRGPQPGDTATTADVAAGSAAADSAETTASPDHYRFRIGALEAIALKDGVIEVANDGKTFGVGQPAEAVAALLAASGLPGETLQLDIQPLLVRDGARVLLFDAGAADAAFARAGRLQASLDAAGIEPGEVTDVFVSHGHPDHVGGLLMGDGAPAFPNAVVHLSAPEWDALQRGEGAARLVAALAPKVSTFEPGAVILPGVVTAVAVEGHTPGHSAYEIASGSERLLYLGDTVHHHVVSLQRPEWTVQFDTDAPVAQASRRALLQQAADGQWRVYSVHFPFPGLGRIVARGDGFAWAPEG